MEEGRRGGGLIGLAALVHAGRAIVLKTAGSLRNSTRDHLVPRHCALARLTTRRAAVFVVVAAHVGAALLTEGIPDIEAFKGSGSLSGPHLIPPAVLRDAVVFADPRPPALGARAVGLVCPPRAAVRRGDAGL